MLNTVLSGKMLQSDWKLFLYSINSYVSRYIFSFFQNSEIIPSIILEWVRNQTVFMW